jgi:hypothetical protein
MLSTTGNYAAGIPALLAGAMQPTSAIAAAPAAMAAGLPEFSYSSMAESMLPSIMGEELPEYAAGSAFRTTPLNQAIGAPPSIAPGMVDQSMAGMAMPPPPMAGQPPIPPMQQANPMATGMGSAADAYLKLRQLQIQEQQARKPFSHAPNIHGGPPIPVKVGQASAMRTSPIERYAAFLRRM